jgi:hypothetical protein
MDTLATNFVTLVDTLVRQYGWARIALQAQAAAEVMLPRISKLQEARVCHLIHPLRVLENVLIAVAERPLPDEAVLAMAIAALGHDSADIPKVTTAGAAHTTDKVSHERRRILFRFEHEALGAANLVRDVGASDAILEAAGVPPIDLDVVYIAYEIAVNHDSASRGRLLPPGPPLVAECLTLFTQADTATMVDWLPPGERGSAPIGPLAELWSSGRPVTAEAVKSQLTSSEAGACRRLQAAFGLPGDAAIEECFSVAELGRAAARNLAGWRQELGE